jgi:hypothetical protein
MKKNEMKKCISCRKMLPANDIPFVVHSVGKMERVHMCVPCAEKLIISKFQPEDIIYYESKN